MIITKKHYKELISTNDTAKETAENGAPEGTLVVADHQSGGRGRAGHTFYSPKGGIYMSLILRPRFSDFTLITPAAAVAVCRALESLGFDCGIKWVNDIYKNGKKVCGILTESNINSGWAVLGIGINTVCPGKDAPDIAGWLYDSDADNGLVTDKVIEEFTKIYDSLPDKSFISYYREKSILKGRKLLIDGAEYDYKGINDDFSLVVSDGEKEVKFICGEVSVKPL
ncbi:MAG: biotin--[Clostridia bacterium]|nr:biotin--[acetyl-CoA-carboxylase] ligase [Clostridia bacterium]